MHNIRGKLNLLQFFGSKWKSIDNLDIDPSRTWNMLKMSFCNKTCSFKKPIFMLLENCNYNGLRLSGKSCIMYTSAHMPKSSKESQFLVEGKWKFNYLICRLIISFPPSSMTRVQLLANWTLTGSGKRQELFENGWERIIRSTYGAGVGTVTEMATRKQIGLESEMLEKGTNSNHFSTVRLESGDWKSSRDIDIEPIVLDVFDTSKLDVEQDISSKSSCPVGSHWKQATCFSPDSDKIVRLLFALKIASGCVLLKDTKRLPLCSTGRFLTLTNSNMTWKVPQPYYLRKEIIKQHCPLPHTFS